MSVKHIVGFALKTVTIAIVMSVAMMWSALQWCR